MKNLLEKEIPKMHSENRAQLVGTIVGVIVGIILFVGVAIPVTLDVISDSNLTGTTALVVDQVPTLLGVAALVLVASIL